MTMLTQMTHQHCDFWMVPLRRFSCITKKFEQFANFAWLLNKQTFFLTQDLTWHNMEHQLRFQLSASLLVSLWEKKLKDLSQDCIFLGVCSPSEIVLYFKGGLHSKIIWYFCLNVLQLLWYFYHIKCQRNVSSLVLWIGEKIWWAGPKYFPGSIWHPYFQSTERKKNRIM